MTIGFNLGWILSECQCGSLSLVNGAKKIARRHAVADQSGVDAHVMKLLRDGVVSNPRRRPDEHPDVVEVLGSPSEDVAPPQPTTAKKNRLRR
jgi:hypothetical protein